MSSTNAPFNGHGQISQHDTENQYSPFIGRPSSRRTHSLSSSPSFSSSNSSDDQNSSCSPTTTLNGLGRIPFSWEKIPGIPKNKHVPKNNSIDEPSLNFLPLPPYAKKFSKKETSLATNQKKYHISDTFRKDPFFAALVECSKGSDEHDSISNFFKNSRVTRTLSDRLGFVGTYTNSCKSTCTVSQSIVYLPRARTRDLYHRRRSR